MKAALGRVLFSPGPIDLPGLLHAAETVSGCPLMWVGKPPGWGLTDGQVPLVCLSWMTFLVFRVNDLWVG